jgi:1,4-dihydroxy-2-naphthoyl-CoA hydrolase
MAEQWWQRDGAESPLGRWMGFETTVVEPDKVVTRLSVRPEQMNPVGAIHGGTMLALADNNATKMANRANAVGPNAGRFMIGIDLHCVMLRNQAGGTIEAVSRVVRAGARVTVIRTEIRGEDGKALMEVTTTHIPG